VRRRPRIGTGAQLGRKLRRSDAGREEVRRGHSRRGRRRLRRGARRGRGRRGRRRGPHRLLPRAAALQQRASGRGSPGPRGPRHVGTPLGRRLGVIRWRRCPVPPSPSPEPQAETGKSQPNCPDALDVLRQTLGVHYECTFFAYLPAGPSVSKHDRPKILQNFFLSWRQFQVKLFTILSYAQRRVEIFFISRE